MKTKGFTLIEFCIVVAIIGILAAILIPAISTKNEREAKEENVKELSSGKVALTDSEILYSRKYVLDFDQRMERANEQIKNCVGPVTDYKVLRSCTANAYNAQGWEDVDYGKGTVLKVQIVEEYNEHKFASMQPLSTEL